MSHILLDSRLASFHDIGMVSDYDNKSVQGLTRDREELEGLIDAEDAGRFLKLSPKQVIDLARHLVLPGAKLSDEWRFRKSDLLIAFQRMSNVAPSICDTDQSGNLHPRNEPLLTTKEVADLLNLSSSQVRRLAAKGALPGNRFGSEWRFRRSALDSVIDGQASISP